MKRTWFLPLIILLLMHGLSSATILTVGQDGAYQYSSIQAAINASTHGDIVQVSPGEYFEHLDTMGKNISIRSHYYATQAQETIDNTIIHASLPNPCLSIHNQESVSIDGFTLINNLPEVLDYPYVAYPALLGGGIEVYGSASVQIANCVIRNSYGQRAGGIYFEGINFSMSNTEIYSCYSMDGPGGLFVQGHENGSIFFDSVHLNSIYDNTGPFGMDICMGYLSQPLDLVLDTFSVVLTEPDSFWFWFDHSTTLNVTVLNGYIDQIDSDIYVNWEGDDNNTGLSPQAPVKTIAKAVKIIQSNPQHHNTIHVAVGEYNFSGSGQYFPLNMKSHTRLVGEDPEFVILNTENTHRPTFRIRNQSHVTIENFTFIPHIRWTDARFPVQAISSESIELRNLHWNGSLEYPYRDHTRIHIYGCDGVIVENITAINATTEHAYNLAVTVQSSVNVFLNNILIDNLDLLDDGFNTGLVVYESGATLRNIVISNCFSITGRMFWYQAWVTQGVNLDLSNMLFINNIDRMETPIYIFNNFERVQIRNSTFAYNDAWGAKIMLLRGYGDINNCIFYNPDNYHTDLMLANIYNGVHYTPRVSYSLFTTPIIVSDSTMAGLYNLMVGVNPLFLGHDTPIWDPTQADSYQLSASSPCINAGNPDVSGLNLPPMDLAGNHRIWDGRVDMGCYEYGADPYVSVHDPDIPPPPENIVLSLFPNPVHINEQKAGYMYIEFSVPVLAAEEPRIQIYNLKGQKIKTLKASKSVIKNKSAGDKPDSGGNLSYSTLYDCSDQFNRKLASGIYLVRVEAGTYQTTGKITIIR